MTAESEGVIILPKHNIFLDFRYFVYFLFYLKQRGRITFFPTTSPSWVRLLVIVFAIIIKNDRPTTRLFQGNKDHLSEKIVIASTSDTSFFHAEFIPVVWGLPLISVTFPWKKRWFKKLPLQISRFSFDMTLSYLMSKLPTDSELHEIFRKSGSQAKKVWEVLEYTHCVDWLGHTFLRAHECINQSVYRYATSQWFWGHNAFGQ